MKERGGKREKEGVRLIRIKQITSDEALSNQLLRLYHKSSLGLRRVTATMKQSASI